MSEDQILLYFEDRNLSAIFVIKVRVRFKMLLTKIYIIVCMHLYLDRQHGSEGPLLHVLGSDSSECLHVPANPTFQVHLPLPGR